MSTSSPRNTGVMRSQDTSIIPLLAMVSVWLACLSLADQCHAFVVSRDENGNQRLWPLHAPAEHHVHTNIINPQSQSIRYSISAEAYSKTNNTAELNAVRAAFDQWQSIPDTALRFEEGNLSYRARDINTSDYTNLIVWAKESHLVNNGRDNIRGVLAITYPRCDSSNTLLEADIVLNGIEFQWFTDFFESSSTAQFIEGTVAHEIGHFLGLEHSPVGGATMFARGDIGISSQAGLSSDDILAAKALYPHKSISGRSSALLGTVLLNSKPVFGAMVLVENAAGNIIAGTITRRDGVFHFQSMPPGAYCLRVAPLHSATAGPLARLISSPDISSAFAGAQTDFLPSPNVAVQLLAGSTNTTNIAVVQGSSPIRLTGIQLPRTTLDQPVVINGPATVPVGATNLIIGVASPDAFAADATLEITGAGLFLGSSTIVYDAFPGSRPSMNIISAPVRISPDSEPGLRSFLVRSGTNMAYANGFLEVLPEQPDYNFDGLDDRFQRQHFARFTSIEAAPSADPDSDLAANQHEFTASTLPLNASSVLRIERITTTADGTTISWKSQPRRSYKVLSRDQAPSGIWEQVGTVVKATEETTAILDRANKSASRFYRIEIIS